MSTNNPIKITYYSDILCIWAYCAQARVDEVARNFTSDVDIDFRYISVFGNTDSKIGSGWNERGGFDGYNAHVQEVARKFIHVDIHPDLWRVTRPASSASPHLFLKAIQLTCDSKTVDQVSWSLREAFFKNALDIADTDVQWQIAEDHNLERGAIEQVLKTGYAMAALMEDYNQQRDNNIKVSPTFELNEGRQALIGNVGYKVIEANIQELLRYDDLTMASWC